MKLLFIGGHADGMRVDVPGNTMFWDVPVKPKPNELEWKELTPDEIAKAEPTIKIERYVRAELAGNIFMVLVELDYQEVMEKLLAGYHPMKESK